MTDAPAPKRRFADLTPLRESPAFRRLWLGNTIAGIGAQSTIVAVGLQIYALTESTFAVSLVGGIALLPMIIAGVWGGMLIDAFDRKKMLLVSALIGWSSTVGLFALAVVDGVLGTEPPLWLLYVLTTLTSLAHVLQGATRQALIPRIVESRLVPAASALNGIGWGIMLTIGPALAGVLVATVGFTWTYFVDLVLFAALFYGIATLPKLAPAEGVARPGWASLKQGVEFLRSAPTLRASFLIDIVAMTFGRPHVLLPAAGAVAIGGGPVTVGILVAAMAVGAFLAGIFSGPVGHIHRHGVAALRAIMIYGGFVALLGVTILLLQTGWFPPVGSDIAQASWWGLALAIVAMAGMGAADEIGRIFRSSMMLMAAPDGMRGRLQGIFAVIVQGGPRVGDVYMGIFATAIALWFPALFGGFLIIAILGLMHSFHQGLRSYDARNPIP